MTPAKTLATNPFALALLSGFLLALTCAGPLAIGPLAWLALVPLFMAATASRPLRAATAGFAGGMLYYVLMLYWIVIVLHTYGHLPWWLAIPVMLLLAAYMSLYLALFSALVSWLAGSISLIWVAPLFWVALDFVRSMLFTGFPWQDLAYSQYNWPAIIQIADIAGHYGLTFLIVMANGMLWATLLSRQGRLSLPNSGSLKKHTTVVICLLVLVLTYNLFRYHDIRRQTERAATISAAVVQGNIPQDQKWTPGLLQKTIETYIDLSKEALASEARPALMIWPETALPLYPMESKIFPYLVDRLGTDNDFCLLTGAPHRERAGDSGAILYYNSAFLLAGQPDQEAFIPAPDIRGRYDKQHLVPFGEYIPLKDYLPLSGPLVETIGDFQAGSRIAPLACGNALVGVLVCYESIFPKLSRRHAEHGANLLVNITNDAWFGRSSAPWQHLSMAVFRAVESRKSLARAANTGISCFIDPLGKITAATPIFESCYRTAALPLLDVWTIHTGWGHYFPAACLLVSGLFVYFRWRKIKK